MRDYSKEINTHGHMFVGVTWDMEGSSDNTYEVKMYENGFTCTCNAFMFRGTNCKHIRKVAKGILGYGKKEYAS